MRLFFADICFTLSILGNKAYHKPKGMHNTATTIMSLIIKKRNDLALNGNKHVPTTRGTLAKTAISFKAEYIKLKDVRQLHHFPWILLIFWYISRHRNTHRIIHYKEILPFNFAGNGGLLIDHFVTFLSFFHDWMNQLRSYFQDMFF